MKTGKQNDGMTMVEVVVAFAVLMLVMGMFAKCLTMANQVFRRSEEILEDSRKLEKGYYLEEEAVLADIVGETLVFTEQEDGGRFSVEVKLREFANDAGSLYDVVSEEEIPE